MRAIIAAKFPAYTFEAIDRLDLEDLLDHYASALWLAEQEGKSGGGTGKRKR